jgi:hypothetical protein
MLLARRGSVALVNSAGACGRRHAANAATASLLRKRIRQQPARLLGLLALQSDFAPESSALPSPSLVCRRWSGPPCAAFSSAATAKAAAAAAASSDDHWLAEGLRWMALDTNEQTRAEIAALVEARDATALRERLGSRLKFGTAGLRGRMGAGYNRMNDVVILQTAQGLCK